MTQKMNYPCRMTLLKLGLDIFKLFASSDEGASKVWHMKIVSLQNFILYLEFATIHLNALKQYNCLTSSIYLMPSMLSSH